MVSIPPKTYGKATEPVMARIVPAGMMPESAAIETVIPQSLVSIYRDNGLTKPEQPTPDIGYTPPVLSAMPSYEEALLTDTEDEEITVTGLLSSAELFQITYDTHQLAKKKHVLSMVIGVFAVIGILVSLVSIFPLVNHWSVVASGETGLTQIVRVAENPESNKFTAVIDYSGTLTTTPLEINNDGKVTRTTANGVQNTNSVAEKVVVHGYVDTVLIKNIPMWISETFGYGRMFFIVLTATLIVVSLILLGCSALARRH